MLETESQPGLVHAAIRGTTWAYIAFYSGKLIVFLSTVVLARLLTKDDFGVVGYAVTAISFLDVVKDLGIGAAVIYHKDRQVASTAFWLNMMVGVGLCIAIWIAAPLVGDFFNDPRATWVTRILAFNFPLFSLGSTHEALLIKDLAFNRKFIPDFAQAMSKGVVSIALAFAGWGPWSLIIGQLCGSLASDIVIWRLLPWRPAFTFARDSARSLLRFGLPLVGLDIIDIGVLNADYLLVGRYLGAAALGVYTLAFRIPDLIVLQFCSIVAKVVFPVFSKIREDADALSNGFLRTARYVSLITVPIGLGMALLARPFIIVVFGQKWIDAAPVMSCIAIYGVMLSLGFNAGDVYKAQGRPGILTRISIVQLCVLVPALYWAVTVTRSLIVVGLVQIGVALLGSAINLVVAVRLLHLSPGRMLGAFRPAAAAGTVLALAVVAVLYSTRGATSIVPLMAGTLAGGAAYAGWLWFVDRATGLELLQLAQIVLRRS